MTETDIIERLCIATGAGMVIGLDREMRGISAGLRTHALVSLSSAMIMVTALIFYDELHAGNQSIDPLRVVQGLAQAIGFISAGVIFVSRGDVKNLTSAANIWMAAAIGIAAGAGQYTLLLTALALGVAILTVMRLIERFIPGSRDEDDPPKASAEKPTRE